MLIRVIHQFHGNRVFFTAEIATDIVSRPFAANHATSIQCVVVVCVQQSLQHCHAMHYSEHSRPVALFTRFASGHSGAPLAMSCTHLWCYTSTIAHSSVHYRITASQPICLSILSPRAITHAFVFHAEVHRYSQCSFRLVYTPMCDHHSIAQYPYLKQLHKSVLCVDSCSCCFHSSATQLWQPWLQGRIFYGAYKIFIKENRSCITNVDREQPI